MLAKITFSMDEKLIEDFRRFCLAENGGKYEPGIYSIQITKAVNMLLESKKPKDEIIDLEELEATGDEFQ